MLLTLDGQGPQHAQLTRALRGAVLAGRLRSGSRLPSTRDLAHELGLSRTTVLTAYEQLRAEGFITGKVGSGSYVTAMEVRPANNAPAAAMAPTSRYVEHMRVARRSRSVPPYEAIRFNLQYGAPLINPALTTAWSRELARAARYTSTRYPDPQGLQPLREGVCDYLARRRGMRVPPERVVIVNGTQQAMQLCARVLVDEGDEVALEEPRYFGAFQVFSAHGARLRPMRTDDEGLVCDELPNAPPRLVFVTPSHQFPSGVVMSLRRRLQLLEYAKRKGTWVVEDDYDSEFRYDTHPLSALAAMDEGDRVIYIGTFSKAMLGSMRLGYMVVPASLRDDFVHAKWLDDMGSPAIEQAALASFMADGGFERHLRRASKMLKARRGALIDGLRRHAGDRIELEDSHAGMHLVVWLRDLDHAQCDALITQAVQHGLGLHPLARHYFSPPSRPGLLLGYAALSPAELEAAMTVFGRCLQAFPPRC